MFGNIYIDTHYIHHYTHMCIYIYTYATIIYIYVCIYPIVSQSYHPINLPKSSGKPGASALRVPGNWALWSARRRFWRSAPAVPGGSPPKKRVAVDCRNSAPPWMVERAINNGKHLAVNWCGFSSVHSMSPLAVAYNYMVADH